jgi:uncharacterized protein (TIGR00730 family)
MASEMGRILAEQGIGLVYGGGKVGLMGEIANAALQGGAEVIGVIPRHLEAREIAHWGLSDLRVVNTMHERKALMADLADAFIALPGGLGTLEECFEVATWTQLGIHAKPLGFLNVRGYFDLLQQVLAKAVEERFLRPEHRSFIFFSEDPAALLATVQAFEPVKVDKWLDPYER